MTTEKTFETKPRNTSLVKAIFNLTKAAVGLGTVLLTKKMQNLGLGYGIIVILLSATMSSFSLHFLNRMSYNLDTGDYIKLGKQALGRKGEILSIVALFLVLIGSLIAYAFFIGDYASSSLDYFFGEQFYTGRIFLTVVFVTLFVFPVSCLKDLSKLAVTSIAGMLLMIAITALVVYKSLTSDICIDAENKFIRKFTELDKFPKLGLAALGSFGSLIFAYMNHFTMVSLTQVLENPTPKRRMILNVAATFIATAIYMTMAIFSYKYYRSFVDVKDALSIPKMSAIFAIAKFMVSIVLVFSFPLLADPTRGSIDSLISIITKECEGFKNATTIRHYSETALVVFLPLLVAVLTGDKSLNVLEVFSSFFGSILVFVLPPVMFLKLKRKYITSPIERVLAYIVIVFGALISILGPISPIKDVVDQIKNPE